MTAAAVLKQFARKRVPGERCELCSAPLAAEHAHLVEPVARKLLCTCTACTLLFGSQGATKYRRVPQRIRRLTDFQLPDALWDGLMIPINMAFFFESSPLGKVIALYPSPAGATESQLPLESWEEIAVLNPILNTMEPDVEALMVNRIGPQRGYEEPEYYLLPIDECYALVGLIRAHWQGFSGGDEAWERLSKFFARMRERSTDDVRARHA